MLVGRRVNGEIQTEPGGVVIMTARELEVLKTVEKIGVYRIGRIEVRIVPEGIVEQESPAR